MAEAIKLKDESQEKGQQNIFICIHALQVRIHFLVLNTKQQTVSPLGGKIAGRSELCVFCVLAKLGNFAKYIVR